MPAFILPLAPGETAHIAPGLAEDLSALLAPLNDPSIQARLGEEREIDRWTEATGEGVIAEGERFPRRGGGWVQGQRYLLRQDGHAVAVLNLTLSQTGAGQETRVSNIYVLPACRRHGLAQSLLAQALRRHPRLVADSSFSAAGAALIGADRLATEVRVRRRVSPR